MPMGFWTEAAKRPSRRDDLVYREIVILREDAHKAMLEGWTDAEIAEAEAPHIKYFRPRNLEAVIAAIRATTLGPGDPDSSSRRNDT
jgi:hypothetical protein